MKPYFCVWKEQLKPMTLIKTAMMAILLLLAASTGAEAMLRGRPKITSVMVDPANPDGIFLKLAGLPCEAAISHDGGASFAVATEPDAPKDWSAELEIGERRYLLIDGTLLLRSNDAGATWQKTQARSFLWNQSDLEVKNQRQWFQEEYRPRLPQRSVWWNPLFGLFAGGHLILTIWVLRRRGCWGASLTALSSLVVLALVWGLMTGLHEYVLEFTSSQFLDAYWYSLPDIAPCPNLGIAMTIAARPLPLLAYLTALWPLLPGSKELLMHWFANRQRLALAISMAAGIAFVGFHLALIAMGPFFDRFYTK